MTNDNNVPTVEEQMHEFTEPLPEKKNGASDLSQRAKQLVHDAMDKSIDGLVTGARAHMQELIEHLMEMQNKIMEETNSELKTILDTAHKNEATLNEQLEKFGKNQRDRKNLISKTIDQQAEAAIGLDSVFSKLNQIE